MPQYWDFRTILELCPKELKSFQCIAQKPNNGGRCQNQGTSKGKSGEANKRVDDMDQRLDIKASLVELSALSPFLICAHHQKDLELKEAEVKRLRMKLVLYVRTRSEKRNSSATGWLAADEEYIKKLAEIDSLARTELKDCLVIDEDLNKLMRILEEDAVLRMNHEVAEVNSMGEEDLYSADGNESTSLPAAKSNETASSREENRGGSGAQTDSVVASASITTLSPRTFDTNFEAGSDMNRYNTLTSVGRPVSSPDHDPQVQIRKASSNDLSNTMSPLYSSKDAPQDKGSSKDAPQDKGYSNDKSIIPVLSIPTIYSPLEVRSTFPKPGIAVPHLSKTLGTSDNARDIPVVPAVEAESRPILEFAPNTESQHITRRSNNKPQAPPWVYVFTGNSSDAPRTVPYVFTYGSDHNFSSKAVERRTCSNQPLPAEAVAHSREFREKAFQYESMESPSSDEKAEVVSFEAEYSAPQTSFLPKTKTEDDGLEQVSISSTCQSDQRLEVSTGIVSSGSNPEEEPTTPSVSKRVDSFGIISKNTTASYSIPITRSATARSRSYSADLVPEFADFRLDNSYVLSSSSDSIEQDGSSYNRRQQGALKRKPVSSSVVAHEKIPRAAEHQEMQEQQLNDKDKSPGKSSSKSKIMGIRGGIERAKRGYRRASDQFTATFQGKGSKLN